MRKDTVFLVHSGQIGRIRNGKILIWWETDRSSIRELTVFLLGQGFWDTSIYYEISGQKTKRIQDNGWCVEGSDPCSYTWSAMGFIFVKYVIAPSTSQWLFHWPNWYESPRGALWFIPFYDLRAFVRECVTSPPCYFSRSSSSHTHNGFDAD